MDKNPLDEMPKDLVLEVSRLERETGIQMRRNGATAEEIADARRELRRLIMSFINDPNYKRRQQQIQGGPLNEKTTKTQRNPIRV